MYVGEKKLFGKNPVDQAGLLGGKLYCLQIENYPRENATTGMFATIPGGQARFSLLPISAEASERELEVCTEFGRVEDGNWAVDDYSKFFFATTFYSKVWLLSFDDISDPIKGGFAKPLLEGLETPGKW